jgi:solute carrier family 25 2-oxodicarboxylate transporter 21
MQTEGVAGFFRGIEPMVLRNAAWNGTYFACIGSIRNFFPAQPGDSRGQSDADLSAFCGRP